MPLRPELYSRLEARFRHVQIANEGQELMASYHRDALTGKQTLDSRQPGEYYRVNCPFCNDTRKRLWINHRWGLKDPVTGSLNLHLCICFNENCVATIKERRSWLYAEVMADVGDGSLDVVLPSFKTRPAEPVKAELPGDLVTLDHLPADHPACQYLRDRAFDPALLGQRLGVGYCPVANWNVQMATGRIIIPIMMDGQLRGWQSRYIGDPPNKFVPKYYTMPGMRKTELLYNIDPARKYPYVVLVEGVTDVWKVGPVSVALFGKTLSATQELLISSIWNKGTVYVMLDSDAADDGRKIVERLRGRVGKCVLVELPDDRDPGDLSQEELRRQIEEACCTECAVA